MRRCQRRNTLQICPRRDSNSGGSDLWSNALPTRPWKRASNMMQQQMMYNDEEPTFQQPGRPPYERNEPFSKDHGGIYRPPYFFANATSLIMALVGTVFFFISFGGPVWYDVPPENTIVPKTFGLWRLCVRSLIQAYENYLMPVKVLMCVATIFIFIMMSSNLAFIAGFPTYFLEAVTQMFVGLLTAIAVGIFGGNFRDDKNQAPFGWAYWCGVVAAMILIVNGAIMMAISMFVYRKRGGFTRRK
ncbi:hypothetical protein LSH36_121g02023 [Paralvinella palmiformis]|uniref:Uncharacterized protein n=1 Tax=Paralvinella palmiformis TaxID=53620 RepID=A0AAD9N8K0_9ANNE|nr:hypothetical protein LSH36_121g02023 [Paralvinella palmiformis]